MYTILETHGELKAKRGRQRVRWMWSRMMDILMSRVRNDPIVRAKVESLEADVIDGRIDATTAADSILETFTNQKK